MLVEYFLHDWNDEDTEDTTQGYHKQGDRCIEPCPVVTAMILIDMDIILVVMIIFLVMIFSFFVEYSLNLILFCAFPW